MNANGYKHGYMKDIVRYLESRFNIHPGAMESLRAFVEELRDEYLARRHWREYYWDVYHVAVTTLNLNGVISFRHTGGTRGLVRPCHIRPLLSRAGLFPGGSTNPAHRPTTILGFGPLH